MTDRWGKGRNRQVHVDRRDRSRTHTHELSSGSSVELLSESTELRSVLLTDLKHFETTNRVTGQVLF